MKSLSDLITNVSRLTNDDYYMNNYVLKHADQPFRPIVNGGKVVFRSVLNRSTRRSSGGGRYPSDLQSSPEPFLEIHNDMG